MSERRLIDTNVIVRHLVQDHEKNAKAAGKLFDACDRGELTLVILPVVLAECVFVLESFYKQPRDPIADALKSLIRSPGIEIDGPATHRDALDRFSRGKAHFVDCLLAAQAVADDVAVATFDADFKRFEDVRIAID